MIKKHLHCPSCVQALEAEQPCIEDSNYVNFASLGGLIIVVSPSVVQIRSATERMYSTTNGIK